MRVVVRPFAVLFGAIGIIAVPPQSVMTAHTTNEFMVVIANWLVIALLVGSVSLSWRPE